MKAEANGRTMRIAHAWSHAAAHMIVRLLQATGNAGTIKTQHFESQHARKRYVKSNVTVETKCRHSQGSIAATTPERAVRTRTPSTRTENALRYRMYTYVYIVIYRYIPVCM